MKEGRNEGRKHGRGKERKRTYKRKTYGGKQCTKGRMDVRKELRRMNYYMKERTNGKRRKGNEDACKEGRKR